MIDCPLTEDDVKLQTVLMKALNNAQLKIKVVKPKIETQKTGLVGLFSSIKLAIDHIRSELALGKVELVAGVGLGGLIGLVASAKEHNVKKIVAPCAGSLYLALIMGDYWTSRLELERGQIIVAIRYSGAESLLREIDPLLLSQLYYEKDIFLGWLAGYEPFPKESVIALWNELRKRERQGVKPSVFEFKLHEDVAELLSSWLMSE